MRSDESGTNSVARPSRATADRAVDDYAYVEVPGGRIAYEVTGQGPLVVLSHGIGDLRQSYRFLAMPKCRRPRPWRRIGPRVVT